MNFRDIFLNIGFIAVVLVFCCSFACGCTDTDNVSTAGPAGGGGDDAAEALQYLESGVNSSLSDTLALAGETSGALADIDRNRTQVNVILGDAQERFSWIDSAAFISPGGQIVAIMPESYSDLVGVDLSYQEIVQEALANRSPVMSDYMLLDEGVMGTLLEYPVYSEDGEYAGILSFAFTPAELIEPYAEDIKSKYGYSVMAAQPDGIILYDEDPEEIGNETFGNPAYEAYPSLIAFAEEYSSSPSGTYNYTFKATGSADEVQKQAFWDTVEILDKEWRVMVIKEI